MFSPAQMVTVNEYGNYFKRTAIAFNCTPDKAEWFNKIVHIHPKIEEEAEEVLNTESQIVQSSSAHILDSVNSTHPNMLQQFIQNDTQLIPAPVQQKQTAPRFKLHKDLFNERMILNFTELQGHTIKNDELNLILNDMRYAPISKDVQQIGDLARAPVPFQTKQTSRKRLVRDSVIAPPPQKVARIENPTQKYSAKSFIIEVNELGRRITEYQVARPIYKPDLNLSRAIDNYLQKFKK